MDQENIKTIKKFMNAEVSTMENSTINAVNAVDYNRITKTVDCYHENCPMPLVKTRKAIMEALKGEIIKVVGDHPQSYDEIPMALEAQGIGVLERGKIEDGWYVIFAV
jgi:TusA-related sulfurtransferase